MPSVRAVWQEQCEAAAWIRDNFGVRKAIGYLVGEKLINLVQRSRSHPGLKPELELFAARIRELFAVRDLHSYFRDVGRVGPLGHIMDDGSYREFVRRGLTSEGPAELAEDILLVEQACKLVMDGIMG